MTRTPGPWKASKIGEGQYEKPGVFTADTHQVADVFVHGGIEQARLHASLMAAAPELLAAVQAVQRARNIKDAGEADDAMSDADILIEEAIAKAVSAGNMNEAS